jgi:hypothetical protein
LKSKPPSFYEFPYVRFHGRYYPLIPVTLVKGAKNVSTFALLDSGASMCVFRPEIAKALGVRLKGPTSARLGTAGGQVDVQMSTVSMRVQKTKFSANVGFLNRPVVAFNILGRDGFFKKFSVAFNEIMKTTVLVPLETIS